jgi:hypothetical protein
LREHRVGAISLTAAHISALAELRTCLEDAKFHQGSEFFEWFSPDHGNAICAGIAALADSIDTQLESAPAVRT